MLSIHLGPLQSTSVSKTDVLPEEQGTAISGVPPSRAHRMSRPLQHKRWLMRRGGWRNMNRTTRSLPFPKNSSSHSPSHLALRVRPPGV